MKTIKIWSDNPSDGQLDELASVLRDGGLALIPTDTLYAIVCDALNPKAIDRLCRLKGINPDKSHLSVICSDISMASEYARIDNGAYRMLKSNTPGPFTFLFRALSSLPRAFKGRKTVGIRIPGSQTALRLAERMEGPLLTTSVEFDDTDYTVNPDLMAEAYEGRVDIMADAGDGGTEPSTIVDCTGHEPEITRQGAGELQ